jgi:hypothetical protein
VAVCGNQDAPRKRAGKYENGGDSAAMLCIRDGAAPAAAAGRLGYYPALRCSRSTNPGARNRLLIEAPN